ncbi:methyltransferase [Streptomyces pratensis]|uniref:methyltransferase n=1 Tax=Streptomyces pratensis TaxID=1169025 RepID=UPI0030159279
MDAALPPPGQVDQWRLGMPAEGLSSRVGTIAFTASALLDGRREAGPAIPLHTAMAEELPRATSVLVRLPEYRGKSLIPVLSWLVVNRLAHPGAEASWYLHKQQGPASCAALLTRLGWRDVRHKREGGLVRVTGLPPRSAELPEAKAFSGAIGSVELDFLADYGVFSPGHVDDGTALLAEVALRQSPVEVLADIGVGYGPLAIGLVRNGVARRAVATDVDCLALWLAERNAAANGVPLTVECTPDPLDVEPTPLTVCNVPTHIPADLSTALTNALAERVRDGGKLLAVVHASLEQRYAHKLAAAGVKVARHPGPAHVVLEARR